MNVSDTRGVTETVDLPATFDPWARVSDLILPYCSGVAHFSLGRVLVDIRASEALRLAGQLPAALLARHVRGDCGVRAPEHKAEVESAIRGGLPVISHYRLQTGTLVGITTNAFRDETVIYSMASDKQEDNEE